MDQIFFLIKPDGIIYEKEILERLVFPIQEYNHITINNYWMSKLYPQMRNDPHWDALKEYLQEDLCGMGLINKASLETILDITGRHTEPELCQPGTIRNIYGKGKGYTRSGLEVIRNAIHRPKTNLQNNIQVEAFYEFLKNEK